MTTNDLGNVPLVIIKHRMCNWSNTMDATSGTGTAYLSGAPEFMS
jgi:hypothetical protein